MQFHKRTQPFIYDTPYIYIYIFSYTYIHIDRFAQQRSTTLQPSFIGKHRWPNIDPMNRGKRSVATIPVIRLNMYLRQFNSINLDVETVPAVFIEPTPPLSNLLSGGQTGGAPSTPAFLFHPPLYKRVDCVFIYSLRPCASKRTRGVHPSTRYLRQQLNGDLWFLCAPHRPILFSNVVRHPFSFLFFFLPSLFFLRFSQGFSIERIRSLPRVFSTAITFSEINGKPREGESFHSGLSFEKLICRSRFVNARREKIEWCVFFFDRFRKNEYCQDRGWIGPSTSPLYLGLHPPANSKNEDVRTTG